MPQTFAPIPELLAELAAGRMILLVDGQVVDGEVREDEGDFVMAAQHVTAEAITMMTRYASGIITVPMTDSRLRHLQLDLMVPDNRESFQTAFTVTVDAKDGITTGSSADDRVRTIRLLADPATEPQALVRPGHVNPLLARTGGVLVRAGHTEAGVDLVRLAGLQPCAVICEIMNDHGQMANLPELRQLASQLGLKLGRIADLIAYRLTHESLVEQVAEQPLHSHFSGDFRLLTFRALTDGQQHLVLVKGDVRHSDQPVLVRMHSLNLFSDLLGGHFDGGEADGLRRAMQILDQQGSGVLVLLHGGCDFDGGFAQMILPKDGAEFAPQRAKPVLRRYGIGAQILKTLGLHQIVLLTNHPKTIVGLDGFGLQVTAFREFS
jgi:3,4-dihydroxy 2-butanone 4-phosphate synthase/GTP cyclohydrolase II